MPLILIAMEEMFKAVIVSLQALEVLFFVRNEKVRVCLDNSVETTDALSNL